MASNLFRRRLNFMTSTPNERARQQAAREMEERLGPLDQAIGEPSRDRSPRRVSRETRRTVRAWNRRHGRDDDTDVLTSGSERERRLRTRNRNRVTRAGERFGEGVSESFTQQAGGIGEEFGRGVSQAVSDYATTQIRAARGWVWDHTLGWVYENAINPQNWKDTASALYHKARGTSSDPMVSRDNYMRELVEDNPVLKPKISYNKRTNEGAVAGMPNFQSLDSDISNNIVEASPLPVRKDQSRSLFKKTKRKDPVKEARDNTRDTIDKQKRDLRVRKQKALDLRKQYEDDLVNRRYTVEERERQNAHLNNLEFQNDKIENQIRAAETAFNRAENLGTDRAVKTTFDEFTYDHAMNPVSSLHGPSVDATQEKIITPNVDKHYNTGMRNNGLDSGQDRIYPNLPPSVKSSPHLPNEMKQREGWGAFLGRHAVNILGGVGEGIRGAVSNRNLQGMEIKDLGTSSPPPPSEKQEETSFITQPSLDIEDEPKPKPQPQSSLPPPPPPPPPSPPQIYPNLPQVLSERSTPLVDSSGRRKLPETPNATPQRPSSIPIGRNPRAKWANEKIREAKANPPPPNIRPFSGTAGERNFENFLTADDERRRKAHLAATTASNIEIPNPTEERMNREDQLKDIKSNKRTLDPSTVPLTTPKQTFNPSNAKTGRQKRVESFGLQPISRKTMNTFMKQLKRSMNKIPPGHPFPDTPIDSTISEPDRTLVPGMKRHLDTIEEETTFSDTGIPPRVTHTPTAPPLSGEEQLPLIIQTFLLEKSLENKLR